MMSYLFLLPYGFAFMFFVSAVTKCFSMFEFRQSIVHFDVISRKYVMISSFLVIFMEFILAICFSQLVFLHVAFILTGLLMIFFTALFIRASKQKKSFACSCFGVSTNKTNMKLAILRNSLLLLGAIWGACIANQLERLPYAQENIMSYLIAVAFFIHAYKELHILYKMKKKIGMIVP
ncbi:MauE/DoxX family redox-associated membrane protein [Brevibacillus laterosporus]|uniref:MauE/DoxX family redox-associated membrane protein n=1 Tax=Brevibacillus laterosporus TaxID=1465 RepID=UPI002E1C4B34|nr:MauE/DoxX family redox-associated membrane protein [Brevibacillus laterosporus]